MNYTESSNFLDFDTYTCDGDLSAIFSENFPHLDDSSTVTNFPFADWNQPTCHVPNHVPNHVPYIEEQSNNMDMESTFMQGENTMVTRVPDENETELFNKKLSAMHLDDLFIVATNFSVADLDLPTIHAPNVEAQTNMNIEMEPTFLQGENNIEMPSAEAVINFASEEASNPRVPDQKEADVLHRKRSNVRLELDDIKKHFNVPISVAAKEMNVGVTMLKKRCRELKIRRWPHRKIKSLKCLIENVKELGLQNEVGDLEQHMSIMEQQPDTGLTERTKKLRQACFKANYKRRSVAHGYSKRTTSADIYFNGYFN